MSISKVRGSLTLAMFLPKDTQTSYIEMLFEDFLPRPPPVSDPTELRDSIMLLQDQLAEMKKDVQDLSGQFFSF